MLAVLDDRHAQVTQMLRVFHLLEQDPGAALLAREVLDVRLDRVLHDVVAEHHDELVAVDEVLGQAERLGDAAGLGLVGVAQALHPSSRPSPSSRRNSPAGCRR